MPGLVRMLKDSHSDLRAIAVPMLCEIGSVEAYEVVIRALTDPDSAGSARPSKLLLQDASNTARPLIPVLIERQASDPDAGVTVITSIARADRDEHHGDLADQSPGARGRESRGPRHGSALLRASDPLPALEELRRAVRDDDAEVRHEALMALSQIGMNDPAAILAICEALDDPRCTRSCQEGNRRGGLETNELYGLAT